MKKIVIIIFACFYSFIIQAQTTETLKSIAYIGNGGSYYVDKPTIVKIDPLNTSLYEVALQEIPHMSMGTHTQAAYILPTNPKKVWHFLNTFNITTGEHLPIGNTLDFTEYSLAYNYLDGKMYASTFPRLLKKFDPTDIPFQSQTVGSTIYNNGFNALPNGLAIDNNGNGYILEARERGIYAVDLQTAVTTFINYLDIESEYTVSITDMEWDPVTEKFYLLLIYHDPSNSNILINSELRTVDVTTGTTALIGFLDFEEGVPNPRWITFTNNIDQEQSSCDWKGEISGDWVWTVPLEDGSGLSAATEVPYFITGPFVVDETGTYTIKSLQAGWDGFIAVYENLFNPAEPLDYFVAANDNASGLGTSELNIELTAGKKYYLITTGTANDESGAFENTITGPGNVLCGEGPAYISGAVCKDHDVELTADPGAKPFALNNTQFLAADIAVGDEPMIISGMDITVAGNPTNFSIVFYNHAEGAGTPACYICPDVESAPYAIVPANIVSSEVVGSYSHMNTLLDIKTFRLEFSEPITLAANTTYWMSPDTNAAFWMTSAEKIVGFGSMRYYQIFAGLSLWDRDWNEYVYTLHCETPPAPENDECSQAIALSCGDSVNGSTEDALDDGGNAAPDVFYTYTGSGTPELVTVSLCGSQFDTYLRVYSDCTLTHEIASNDNGCTDSLSSQLSFVSDGTSAYVIMVEGYEEAYGEYTLTLSCANQPENCEEFIVADNQMQGARYFSNDLFVDIPVGANSFNLEGIEITVAGNASDFNVTFFSDNEGLPGEEIISVEGTIASSETVGTGWGYDFLKYTLEFGQLVSLDANTKYWMQVESDAVAWDFTTESLIGVPSLVDSGSGPLSTNGEFVYSLLCETLGVEGTDLFSFTYYPNPAKDYLQIESVKAINNISVYDLAGRKVLNNVSYENGKVNTSVLPAGTYVFRVILEDGQLETLKIIKK